ncbi:hypothetical protein [Ralstonia pseudosolanacearum]|uniref:hypothetical protein n=1 Tax=Ralstonia pseudosolanacearum TaxID=1310165 RepID=UPI0013156340|nr:hypothetical protein [Ralstonia pseudosolanacearum]
MKSSDRIIKSSAHSREWPATFEDADDLQPSITNAARQSQRETPRHPLASPTFLEKFTQQTSALLLYAAIRCLTGTVLTFYSFHRNRCQTILHRSIDSAPKKKKAAQKKSNRRIKTNLQRNKIHIQPIRFDLCEKLIRKKFQIRRAVR